MSGLAQRVMRGTRRPANWVQLVKFGLVGASGYVVNLTVFTLLVTAADLHHLLAAVGAFLVAVTNNFLLNRRWTFVVSGGTAHVQAVRFLTVSIAALGVNLGVLHLLVEVVGLPAVPGQAMAVAVAMPFNFVGNKLWTFAAGLDRPERA